MKLLVLGGTIFLGRHFVQAALERGHTVTLLTRGRHNPDLFPEAEKLVADRDGGLDALDGRTFDAVLDTSGYVPRVVRQAVDALAGRVGHYTFISSISVYADFSRPGITEDAPVGTLPDETVEEVDGETYGPLKALCEQAVLRGMPGRALVLRPGLIVGPHDPSDRFTYWPHRVAQGGEVLAPGSPGGHVQIIDARDLAEWNLRLAEEGVAGVFNAVGPAEPLSMGEMLETCVQVANPQARLEWVDEAWLLEAGAQPWTEVPVWVPAGSEEAGIDQVDISRALAAGLTFRPLAHTVRDTLAWDATQPADRALRAGMTRERERELLDRWHARA